MTQTGDFPYNNGHWPYDECARTEPPTTAAAIATITPNVLRDNMAIFLRGYAEGAGYALADAEFLIKWMYSGVLPFNTSHLMDALHDLNAHTRDVYERGYTAGSNDEIAAKGE
jgi:hypothetical protein